jgi:hypothetical protein
MHFERKGKKPAYWMSIPALAFMMNTGCGMLGNKNLPKPPSGGVGGTGCLNGSKDLVNRYVTGQVSADEWKSAFDCVNQSLDFFTSYVRGSTGAGYTPADMYNLVKGFLITNRSVSPDLLWGAFSLKSALFGGSDRELSKDEIELLKTSLDRLQKITADLIPHLAIRQKPNPTRGEILELVAAFNRAGEQMYDFVDTLPVGLLSDKALETIFDELTKSLELPIIENLNDKLFLTKWLMFNTRRDAIEVRDWARIFRFSIGIGGIVLGYKAAVGPAPDPENPPSLSDRLMKDLNLRETLWALALEAKPHVDSMIAAHNGMAPLPLFDHVIEEVPEEMLKGIPRKTLKSTLRPLVRKLMASGSQGGVDQAAINTVYTLLGSWVQDLGYLDRFYEKTGISRESVTPAQMKQALDSYLANLPTARERTEFGEIRTKLLTYTPLFRKRLDPFKGEIYSIQYGPGVGYSHFQNFLVLSIDRVGRHLMKTYAANRGYLNEGDMISFFKDYNDLLAALKFIDPTTLNFAQKRLQDMDLFTEVSDGNQQGSIEELVHYAMLITSTYVIIEKMRTEITPVCDQGLGEDNMGWTWLPARCFRSQFNERLDYWIKDDFPRFHRYWLTLDSTQRQKAMTWLEHGSRRNGYTEADFGKYDINALGVILHYTESLFNRFDFNGNEALSRGEVDSAYPVFKGILKKTATEKGLNTSSDFLLKGIYTYIVRYQEMPLTPANAANIGKLAWWMASYMLPTTDYSSNRYGVFNIVCQIAKPENPSQAPANATVCAP